MPEGRWRAAAPLLIALVAAVLFRLPVLLNADALNSDAAIVGVQARHFLDGDFAPRLWGARYQASLDVAFVAVVFAVMRGSSALGVLLVPLLGMLAMISLVWALLRRALGGWGALLAVGPLVFATQAVNMPMTYVLRQSLVLWAIAAVWVFENARGRVRWLAVGAVLVGAGPWLDTFFYVMLPPLVLFGLWRALEAPDRRRAVVVVLVCTALAAIVLAAPRGKVGELAVDADALRARWSLLSRQCLPFALGVRTWMTGSVLWSPPLAVTVLQGVAAVAFAACVLAGALLRRDRSLWAFGVMGFVAGATALGGFMASSAPLDMWSTRYLAPLLWFSPFAVAPVIARLGARRAALVLGPFVVSAAVSGWAAYGPFVDGPSIVRTPEGRGVDLPELAAELRSRGVHFAYAPYWDAYRLSLLWQEDPVVVPLEPDLDRQPALRERVGAAERVASIERVGDPPPEVSPPEVAVTVGTWRAVIRPQPLP